MSAPPYRTGFAIWSFKGWAGSFYPHGATSDDFLKLYSQRVTAVEGNTTFYATPGVSTVQKWASQVPEGFRFCPKLPRDVTHAGALRPMLPQALAFLERMQLLGQNLGPCFVQLPPTYGPEMLGDLANFLGPWPRQQARVVVEVRHPAWFREPHASSLRKLLDNLGVGRVTLDTRPIYEADPDRPVFQSRPKPYLPLALDVTASLAFVRFITHPEPRFNVPYIKEWVRRVDLWLEAGTEVYFFVHCPDDTHSPGTMRDFHGQLLERGAPVEPLPWSTIPDPPSQLKLF